MDMRKLLDTQLNQSELAKLFGVTRVTVNHWMTGRFNPDQKNIDRIRDISSKLCAALDQGLLPLPAGVGKSNRVPTTRKLIGLTD